MATEDQLLKKREVINNQVNPPSDGGMFMTNQINTNSITQPKSVTPNDVVNSPSTPMNAGVAQTAGANALAPNTLMQQNPAIMSKGAVNPATTSAGATPAPTNAPIEPTVKPIEVDFSKGGVFDQQRGIIDEQYKSDQDYLQKQYDHAMQNLNQQRENQLKQYGVNVDEVNRNYQEASDKLSEALYQQQELANVEAQRRGISTSPQALGLKFANNQTYQKNLVRLSEDKARKLSELNMKLLELEQGYGQQVSGLNLDFLGQRNELLTNKNNSMWDSRFAEYQDSKK